MSKHIKELADIKIGVEKEIIQSIEDGYDTFISDAEYGYDLFCMEIVAELKKKYDIKLYAYLSSNTKQKRWIAKNRKKYLEVLEMCDDMYILCDYNNTYIKENMYNYFAHNIGKLIYYTDYLCCYNITGHIKLVKTECFECVNIASNKTNEFLSIDDIYKEETKDYKLKIIKKSSGDCSE